MHFIALVIILQIHPQKIKSVRKDVSEGNLVQISNTEFDRNKHQFQMD